MEQFSLEKYLENPRRKITTRYGDREVRIICTDRKDRHPIVALMINLDDGSEYITTHSINGWIDDKEKYPDKRDLFFADEKENLSEDERIRKELLDYLKRFIPHHDIDLVTKSKAWIAWLEKQGEQKPTNNIKPKFKVGDRVNQNDREDEEYNILIITSVNIDEHCYICHQDSVIDFEEQDLWHIVEQNPAWSEEDEKNLNFWLDNNKSIDSDKRNWLKFLKDRVQSKQEWSDEEKGMVNATINVLRNVGHDNLAEYWLKSLKPLKANPRFPQYDNIVDKVFGAGNIESWERKDAEQLVLLAKEELENSYMPHNHWKPSKEQMEALAIAVHDAHGRSYYNKLFSIYNYLKNL